MRAAIRRGANASSRWYSRPSNSALPRAGLQAPNAYGVHDLHGLVWEWTDDYSALLVAGDNRDQGDAGPARSSAAPARCRWTTATTTRC